MTLFPRPFSNCYRDDCRTRALRLWMRMRAGYYKHWPQRSKGA